MDFDGWSLVYAQRQIVVKVALLDTSALHVDPPFEYRRHAIHSRALNLSARAAGIHDAAAVDRGCDTVHSDGPGIIDLDISDVGGIGSLIVAARNPLSPARGDLVAPAAALRGYLEHALQYSDVRSGPASAARQRQSDLDQARITQKLQAKL